MVEILKPSNKSFSSLNFVQKSPREQMSYLPPEWSYGARKFYMVEILHL